MEGCWAAHAGAAEEGAAEAGAEGGGGAAHVGAAGEGVPEERPRDGAGGAGLREAGFVVQVVNSATCPLCILVLLLYCSLYCPLYHLHGYEDPCLAPPHHLTHLPCPPHLTRLPQPRSLLSLTSPCPAPPSQVLLSLASAGRFLLTSKLLGPSARPVLASLFASLQAALDARRAAEESGRQADADESAGCGLCSQEEFNGLRAQYGV